MNTPEDLGDVTAKAAITAREQIDDTEYLVGALEEAQQQDAMIDGLSAAQRAEYDRLALDRAAGGPTAKRLTDGDIVRQRTQQQMDISAADRATREEAGLPPRVHDLT
jgi:hypothetical protein